MKIFIYPNFEKPHASECAESVCSILTGLGAQIILSDSSKNMINPSSATFLSPDEAAKSCDMMISIGGDGTILKCAGLAAKNEKPLLGINCGRLGFMASLERDELSLLERLISGDYVLDERMMADAVIDYSDGRKVTLTALNEAVISSGGERGIHDYTVLADGVTVSSLRADGLIFSTPTGASAYSLSAGGPLIEPSLDCIEFTQICPHSLFARTMLFSPEKNIEVRFKSDGNALAEVSVDGCEPLKLSQSDRLTIRRSRLRLKLIDISGGSYFKAVNRKLMRPAKQSDAQ